ncbi:MAG TPA: hypothetical protein DD437_05035 [Rhodobiaceae bacterium]|nr:hypothetical protein [Rhodobiaceae bacterium]
MTEYEAKFSLHHTVAAGLLFDQVDFAAFGESARARLQSLGAKVRPYVEERYASAYPRAWGSSVTLTLKSGETISETRSHAKGDPEAALSREEMIGKATMLLNHAQIEESTRFIDAVLALADDGQLPALPDGL